MGGGIAIAAIFICLWAPVVLLAGYVGLLVDRMETRSLLLVVSAGQAVVAVGLALLHSQVLLYVLAALLGVGIAVAQAAEFALDPRRRRRAPAPEGERDRGDRPRARLHARPALRRAPRRRGWDHRRDARRRRVVRRRRSRCTLALACAASAAPRPRASRVAHGTGSDSSSPTPSSP